MPLQNDPWNSLEIIKLLVGVLTPLTVAAFGWFISRRLKSLDLALWSNQKLIEKRLVVYDTIAPSLNRLLCFYSWLGEWKEISPEDVIKAKRELDKTVNIYRHLFDNNVYENYQSFIHTLFETYSGPGHDARIRSQIRGPDGDRTTHCAFTWNQAWNSKFSSDNVAEKAEVRNGYYKLMDSLRCSLGIKY